jgi:hypothetical protein
MEIAEVFGKSERFRDGFMAGFYDALADDGLRYLDEIWCYATRDGDEEHLKAGYRAGRLARLGALTPWPDPPRPSINRAA